jgi:hypothetical protein
MMIVAIIALWYLFDIDWLRVTVNEWLTRHVLRYFILFKDVHKDMHTYIIYLYLISYGVESCYSSKIDQKW